MGQRRYAVSIECSIFVKAAAAAGELLTDFDAPQVFEMGIKSGSICEETGRRKRKSSLFSRLTHEQARRGTVVSACSDRGASLVHLMILEDVMNSLTAELRYQQARASGFEHGCHG